MDEVTETATAVPERPVLTLPEEAAEWVRESYGAASVILEYGSGGSTVLAAEAGGKTVFSVESDKAWSQMMQRYFDANPPKSTVHLHYANIGKTKEWGRPVSDTRWRRYHRYPLSVWDREDFQHPDVVLIDGRFRVACLLTTLYRIERPVIALFDDYAGRDKYHEVEEFVKPVDVRGRMARFELLPDELPRRDLTQILTLYTKTF